MTLLAAFRLALQDLRAPEARRVLWRSVGLSVAVFGVLAVGVQAGIGALTGDQAGWIRTLLDILGGLATLAVVWIVFPSVATFFAGAMLDGLVGGVEQRHYPRQDATGSSWSESLAASARFALVAIALNLVLLPMYIGLLFVPPLAPVAFFSVNGYLLCREYFELVALRHLDPRALAALRKQHGGRLFLAGVILALLFAVPVVNLFAPVLGAAAMVHVFHGLKR